MRLHHVAAGPPCEAALAPCMHVWMAPAHAPCVSAVDARGPQWQGLSGAGAHGDASTASSRASGVTIAGMMTCCHLSHVPKERAPPFACCGRCKPDQVCEHMLLMEVWWSTFPSGALLESVCRHCVGRTK